MSATVAIIGGGYGGAAAAKALDDVADVILIEPRDAFVHNVGSLRAVVRPEWMPQIFYPYDNLLARGRVVRDRAVGVDAEKVTLASGETVAADYIVLATGSRYPFPAKSNLDDTAAAQDRYRAAYHQLAPAERVVLFGAGPVGLEFAGEIKAEWPDKQVVLIDPAAEILADYDRELRDEIRSQLDALGVRLALGSPAAEPPSLDGVRGGFTVTTEAGESFDGDIWFRCHGVFPITDYLTGTLSSARQADGRIQVGGTLQVAGHDSVFALGDITTVPEAKRAGSAMRHGEVIAENIRALIAGEAAVTEYEPSSGFILLPLGPNGGAGQMPGAGVVGAETASQYKGADMMLGRFNEIFGRA
ncbi:NAD(P)/FAD-dependent oxidoreductase [Sinosporangium siamense]|uniref:FAD/NAD(P)-binding domain-containing protein n=1 Tax=Sinosporangium siamense TaxID=1367973 RepID=A0A919RGU0_9ACTN|nr:FAD-dependent oxidoreductase [Sinosporangium siamense]GII93625.1 hypothetical protein Ssi02_38560 [Sinosporangium siamense]